jgi:hypothetical protein
MTNCCDYGCDQSPGCPARIKPLAECHVACSPPPKRTGQLAPGVIEGPHHRHNRWLLALRSVLGPRPVRSLVILGALSAVVGFLVGLLYKAGA